MAEDAKDAAAKTPAKKGGLVKKLMLPLIILVVVGGAGFGGMMVGKKQGAKAAAATAGKEKGAADEVAEDAKGGEGTEEAKPEGEGHGEAKAEAGHGEAKAEGGHGEAKEGAAAGGEATNLAFKIDKQTINLADPSGRRYMQISMEVKAASSKALAEMESNKAALLDATITLLGTKTREELQPPSARERLKRELITRYESILSAKSVANIYITQMVFQ